MNIRILGTESLGVRGLSCVVNVNNRRIFIDPGIALGYNRKGLLPHPVQIGVGQIIRKKIINELKDATDIVISHFHGDHVPLMDANPYQLNINQIKITNKCKIWAKKSDAAQANIKRREEAVVLGLEKNINEASGKIDEHLFFSNEVPHGEKGTNLGNVVMTIISYGGKIFVHASDIQFLEENTVYEILKFKPDIVLASGPPVYLQDFMKNRMKKAKKNILKLSESVSTLIIDHHLFRCEEGINWIENISEISSNKIISAAEYMNFPRHMLEAKRKELYESIPVPQKWHQEYINNKVSTDEYLNIARKKFDWFNY